MSDGLQMPASASLPFVHARSVARRFRNGSEILDVLRDVNLDVTEGKAIAISGESGCGKSTLLGIIGGLDRPSGGRVIVGGADITAWDEAALSRYRNREIGFIFQFHFLLKDFTALENVTIPAMLGKESAKVVKARARDLLAEVGLADRLNAWPLELSGVERQRVAVARALMNDPRLLLADEPTGNLDERNAAVVEDLLFDLARRRRRTLVLVTHDSSLAARADTRYVLASGVLATP